jgi:uncharacterized OB-fold protein
MNDVEQKPLPRHTPDNTQFWQGCCAHKILLPTCLHCDRPHWPPGPVCPFCFHDALTWKQASGRGTVSSWVVVHKAWLPAFKADIPYNAVQVELEEGVRLTGNVVGEGAEALHVGMAVEVVFDDVTPDATLPRFTPARRVGP